MNEAVIQALTAAVRIAAYPADKPKEHVFATLVPWSRIQALRTALDDVSNGEVRSMPRGLDAAYRNLGGGARNGIDGSMIFPDIAWLPAVCWCQQEIVGVPQREIVDCRTRSCGRPKCVAPDGLRTIGNAISATLAVQDRLCIDGRMMTPITDRSRYTPKNPLRQHIHKLGRKASVGPPPRRGNANPAYQRPRRQRESPEVIAVRRDLIQMLYIDGKNPPFIAGDLGIPLYQVHDDLRYLRTRGRL